MTTSEKTKTNDLIFLSSMGNALRVIAVKFMKYSCHNAGKH